jgi:hypothetical protein
MLAKFIAELEEIDKILQGCKKCDETGVILNEVYCDCVFGKMLQKRHELELAEKRYDC